MLPDALLGASVRAGAFDGDLDAPVIDRRGGGGPVSLVANRHGARLDVAGVARFAVDGGSSVIVDVARDAAAVDVVSWLHGTVAALVLGQQGRVALHASTVRIGDAGVAVAGARRAGKSTTSLALQSRGHCLVADDVSPLDVTDRVVVTPYGRALHVDAATAGILGFDVPTDAPVLRASGKRAVALASEGSVALDSIVVLVADDAATDVRSAYVDGAAAAALLAEQAYRPAIVGLLWPEVVFSATAAAASRVRVAVLRRPSGSWSVAEVADEVERHVG